ncbi:MAG: beta-galactosidase [Armatimonadota bacterium]
MRALWCILALSCTLARAVPLHDFEDSSQWKPHPDGGVVVVVQADTASVKEGRSALRLLYRDAPPHWGNVVGSCFVPPNAAALRFWVYVHHAVPSARMHIWLIEPDGDMWLQQVTVGAKPISDLPAGWNRVTLPISGFLFDGRGKRTREITSADRMLIGCNFGDLEVSVDGMEWEVREGTSAAPLPVTPNLQVEQGERGSIAVLDMGEPLPDGRRTAHPPQQIARSLRQAGYGVTVLQAGDFADKQVLNPQRFDAVILPCGEFFPLQAREAFLDYLKAGGSFLSTDGYAFDRPVLWDGKGWVDVAQAVTAEEHNRGDGEGIRINTRYGTPGDAMTFTREQIGVFDPAFLLEDAVQVRTTGDFADSPVNLRFAQPLKGFSASGLIGDNNPVFPPVYRRWIPVLEATDAKGNLRGTALSILHNFTGVYRGSSWAFSGVTSGEPLLLGDAARERLLQGVVDRLVQKVYLHSLRTDFACYERGEVARVSVDVANFGKKPASVQVVLKVSGRNILRRNLTLQPGETQTVEGEVNTRGLKGDFFPVEAQMWQGRRRLDTVHTAFCIWDEHVVARGPRVGWQGNYLTINGEPALLVGTNQTGMMFFSANENPAVWDRDFRLMAQHNVRILRILHFSPFAKDGYKGIGQHSSLDLRGVPPDRLQRQMDAIVQLAQKHGIVIFLSLHDWLGVVLTDEELQAQREWNRFWAERYRNVPGIIYDIQNEPVVDVPDLPFVRSLWNRWLKERYGSDEALRTAWRVNPPEAPMPNVPIGNRTDRWDDVRTADLKRFETELLNRWVKANVEGIKEGDPDALVCVGYLPSMPPADKILGTRYTDFSNMHYYGPLRDFPLEFKLIDRRAYGKGFSLGEFGAQEAHNARVYGRTGQPVEESVTRFRQVLHYAVGLGAAFLCNWDWKDFDEMVFPWGVVHHGTPVAKPWLVTLAQGAELLKRVKPVYEPPQVYLLVPDSHRIGARFDQIHRALQNAVGLLLEQRVNFGVLNEEDLQQIPDSAKVIFWPLPYCPTDEAFQTVLSWVQQGGVLYLSGGIGFDRTRQPTRPQRLLSLALPEQPTVPPFDVDEQAWQRDVLISRCGKGQVVFVPYPLELRPQAGDRAMYEQTLRLAGVKGIPVTPRGGEVHALSIPTRDGGRLYALVRSDSGDGLCQVSLPAHGIELTLRQGGTAFVLVNGQGEVVCAESEDTLRLNGELVARASGHYALVSLDGKGVLSSKRILVLPHQQREVELYLLPRGRLMVGRTSAMRSPQSPVLSFAIGESGTVADEAKPSQR